MGIHEPLCGKEVAQRQRTRSRLRGNKNKEDKKGASPQGKVFLPRRLREMYFPSLTEVPPRHDTYQDLAQQCGKPEAENFQCVPRKNGNNL